MPRQYLAAYTTPLTDKTGYRWVWRHQKISDQLLGVFYSKIKKPTDVARWSSNELHGGLASVDSEWCVAYRFLNAGRDALGRQGRICLIAGFLRLNELPQLDLRRTLESPIFSTPLDAPPQSMELALPPLAIRCSQDLLAKLKTDSHVELIGTEYIDQLVAACATLGGDKGFDFKVDGEPVKLRCSLTISHLRRTPEPPPVGNTRLGKGRENKATAAVSERWILAAGGLLVGLLLGIVIGWVICKRLSAPTTPENYNMPPINQTHDARHSGESSDGNPEDYKKNPTTHPARDNKPLPNEKQQ